MAYSDTTKAAVVAAYVAGESVSNISARLGVAGESVRNWVKDAGHAARGKNGRRYSDATKAEVVADYLGGLSGVEITARHGVTYTRVYAWVRQAQHQVRGGGRRKLSVELRSAVVRDYLDGMSQGQTAQKNGVSTSTVRTWLLAAGHTPRKRTASDRPRRLIVPLHAHEREALEKATADSGEDLHDWARQVLLAAADQGGD